MSTSVAAAASWRCRWLLNGAAHVEAIDIEPKAVANTLANGSLNGVGDRLTGTVADLQDWQPPRRYDLAVASLYQLPFDPGGTTETERPPDYWGRELLDRFLRLLPGPPDHARSSPRAPALDHRTGAHRRNPLDELGLEARIVDFGFFPFGPLFSRNAEQIAVVESLSDAHHIHVGDEDVMIAYALEIRHRAA